MDIALFRNSLPHFADIIPATIETNLQLLLDHNRQQLKIILAQHGPYTWDSLMHPIEIMEDELNKYWSPIAHLHAVMESTDLREAYNKSLPFLTQYHTEIAQNEALYQAIESLANSTEFSLLNPAQKKIIENDLRDFRLAGIHLSTEKKARIAELQKQLSQLTTKFSENLLDATQHWILHLTDSHLLEGLPPQAMQLAVENAKQRGLEGYVLTLDYPSYSTAIKFLSNRDIRKTLYEAYTTRASDCGPDAGKWDNSIIMENILKIRHELAQLVGFSNFADYSLATKMAKTPKEVLHFLQDLAIKSKTIAENELNELIEFSRADDDTRTLEAWDISYYSEKLKLSKFHFSQEDLRVYFPIDKVLSGLFTLMNRLYGISIQEEKNIEKWHPDVRFFIITDDQHQLRGGIYIDLYARLHKRDGAWMDECIVRRRLSIDAVQYPVAFLTCNFMPPVNSDMPSENHHPALLNHDDVITLFHEFGHCLHHVLSQIDYPEVASINSLPWDSVEFPSQFMEYFCWEKEVLACIAEHYQTHLPIPDELYEKMTTAKYFETGLQMIRQLEFAIFDFRLHLEFDPKKSTQIQQILNEIREAIAVIHPPEFNRFQHSFSHVFAGGYAAGYYSYKWAEVLSADAYAKFEEKGLFDRATGSSYMKNILEMGGVRDPMVSFVTFRGREPSIDALLRLSGIVIK
ncbi:MAG: oligopeptidase A [Gammaproteobacteria bacterium RIFCSPHIGHO2_12_FULL_37_14]|nr:MAG: oligopeptidase A [Gammaproteobacteria bacterium RIFCSPHIGHO2_12_FULL_37_14]